MAFFAASALSKKNQNTSKSKTKQQPKRKLAKDMQKMREQTDSDDDNDSNTKNTAKPKPAKTHKQTHKFAPSLPTWTPEIQQYIEKQLKQYKYFIKRPHVYPCQNFDAFVLKIGALLDKRGGDFCWSLDWNPSFLSSLIYHGFLTIASEIQENLWVMLPKLHRERCVIDMDTKSTGCHLPLPISKSTKKRAKRYTMTVDQCFERVFQACIDQHGLNWLYPPMQACLYGIHHGRGDDGLHGVSAHSIEIWNENDELVAGELGTAVGCIYTSLTGFYTESGAGSVQLLALSHWLQKCGFKLWDLGMFIDYKASLGAGLLPRDAFLKLYASWRQVKDATLQCEQKTNCQQIVNDVVKQQQKPNEENSIEMKENETVDETQATEKMSKNKQKKLAKMERRKQAKAKQQQKPSNGDTDDDKQI
eukprot:CAMPEP_0202688530 /NCGR_PEP_ID=MMETSP1385-20130828/4030_1 /ASSEMBLY_ACC=CAM_ASM_000861 /TAXON_ID=933848 /ORGANISM="Elphidium margaritaceum" /LENGTH=417 /DNA_ID=CAMNT_0049343523 /DNA_START=16 /DNA_END=1269 /DNA_ORIENTATION=+